MEWWVVVLLVVVAAVIVAIGIAFIALLLQLRKAVAAVSLGVEEGLRLIGELRRLLLPALEVWTRRDSVWRRHSAMLSRRLPQQGDS